MKLTIERLSLEGALIQLAKHFGNVVEDQTTGEIKHTLTCAHITSTDNMGIQNYLSKHKNEEGKVIFPLLGLTTDGILINDNSGYNAGALNRMARAIPTDTASGYLVKKLKLIPTTFECTLSLYTQDYWELFSFARDWMWGIFNKENLNFTCVFANLRISVRIELIDNISLTPKDNSLENNQNYYTGSATLKIHTFLSENKTFDKLPTGSMLQQINIFPSFPSNIEGLEPLAAGFDEDAFIETDDEKIIVIKAEGY